MSDAPKQKPRRRGFMQLRRKDSPDGKWWSPERDITMLLPKLLRQTFYELADPPPEFTEVEEQLGITPDELGMAARIYGKLMRCVLARGEDLQNAVERSGFRVHKVQALVGMMVLDKLVRYFVGCYGQTLHRGEPDPNQRDLKECLTLLEQFEEAINTDGDSASEARGRS